MFAGNGQACSRCKFLSPSREMYQQFEWQFNGLSRLVRNFAAGFKSSGTFDLRGNHEGRILRNDSTTVSKYSAKSDPYFSPMLSRVAVSVLYSSHFFLHPPVQQMKKCEISVGRAIIFVSQIATNCKRIVERSRGSWSGRETGFLEYLSAYALEWKTLTSTCHALCIFRESN
jgi:hypothetical protein